MARLEEEVAQPRQAVSSDATIDQADVITWAQSHKPMPVPIQEALEQAPRDLPRADTAWS
ncbi:hypothetical protein [Streptomyces sp. NPDC001975]